jgi:hypothetical protein
MSAHSRKVRERVEDGLLRLLLADNLHIVLVMSVSKWEFSIPRLLVRPYCAGSSRGQGGYHIKRGSTPD